MTKVTLTYNGVKYAGYELLTPNLEYLTPDSFYFGTDEDNLLTNVNGIMKDSYSLVTPPDGSSLYVAQPCPLCNADIRKHYKIKRSPDTADYAVVSPIGYYGSRISFNTAIVKETKQIFCFFSNQWSRTHSMYAHLDDCVPNCVNTAIIISEPLRLYYAPLSDFYISFISGTYAKPCVYYEKLNMDTGNKLDTDLLYLIYKASFCSRSKDDCDKLVLLLQSLNQTNWREYPRTLYLLFKELCSRGKTYGEAAFSESKLPKSCKQFAYHNTQFAGYVSPEDHELSRQLLSLILGLNETKYVKYSTAYNKFNDIGLPPSTVDEFFDVAVRISPK